MEQQPQASSSATTTSPSSSSQRRELQGPRPAPLRLHKDSHKIKKPGPPQPQHVGPVQQVRQPVIVYTVSPKVVHAKPSEFMSVVQRLTGARGHGATATSSSSSSLPAPPPPDLRTAEPHHQVQMTTSSSAPFPFPFLGGQHVHASSSGQLLAPVAPHFPFQQQQQQAPRGGTASQSQHDDLMIHQLSPAARFATIEQAAASARSSSGVTATANVVGGGLLAPFPSILSPGSLPPRFFSPPAPGGNSYWPGISLLGGLISPAFLGLGSETIVGGGSTSVASATHQSVMSSSPFQQEEEASPSTVTVAPSPSAGAYYWDLFNNQQH